MDIPPLLLPSIVLACFSLFAHTDICRSRRSPRSDYGCPLAARNNRDDDRNDNAPPSRHRRPWQFHVAPMQGYTSRPLRTLYRLLSPDAVLWTEMEKVEDLLAADEDGWKRRFGRDRREEGDTAGSSSERRSTGGTVLQLGGSDPALIRRCLSRASSGGYAPLFRGVDLNCGCPSVESGGAETYGASLMRRPELTGELVSAVRGAVDGSWGGASDGASGRAEVSVKTRIAVFDSLEDMTDAPPDLGEERYASLRNFLARIESCGADHVVLHARPVVLSGLSPSKNRVVPRINYDFVERAASDFPGMRVTLNGGISSLSDLASVFGGGLPDNGGGGWREASHMAGRWMLRRPLDLAAVQRCYLSPHASQEKEVIDIPIANAVQLYVEYAERSLADARGRGGQQCPTTAELMLPLYLVVEQLREDYDGCFFREEVGDRALLNAVDMETIYQTVVDILVWMEEPSSTGRGGKRSRKSKIPLRDSYSFKKLAASFKGIVGKKVANKWKRNRAEL